MNRNIIFIIVLIFFLGLGASWVINKANSSHQLPIIKLVPEFAFINQDGDTFTEKRLLDKITVLDFMFTNCPGPCPMMTHNMAGLYNDFAGVSEVQFISVTVDPDNDSQETLKNYASLNGVNDQRWNFLFSGIDSIKKLKRDGFMLFADDLPRGHAIKFVLIDAEGNIRQYYDGTDKASMKILRKDITLLVKKMRT
jgi:protein SCO1/2